MTPHCFTMEVLLQLVLLSIIAAVSCQNETQKTQLADYIASKKASLNLRYRLRYHLAPPVGWMNDPNGFSFFKGEYHVFYQFYPYDSKWGPMHWGHSTSTNLVDWKEQPTALIPGMEQCFSGSGVVDGDQLVLMYTGHVNSTISPFYNESQYLANSTDGINFVKYEGNPVILGSPNGSPDFRDPKVWKHNNTWYVVIGSKTDDNFGRVLLYKSPDLKTWEYLSEIDKSNGTMGYMWECPDFFELNGKYILLMSPQGMEAQGDRYKNKFQTGYKIGTFDYTTNKFVVEEEFKEIDFGHDFYATQTIEQNGRRIMIAWFSMWDVPYPEAVDGWVGAMTIMRELSLVGNRIIQKPVAEMTSLRSSKHSVTVFASNQSIEFEKTAEINVKADLNQSINILIEGTSGGGKAWIKWDPTTQKVIVERGTNDTRQMEWVRINSTSWRMFLDASSMELFCGDGEVVFSSRVYPDGNWKVTNLSPQALDVEAYYLRTSVPFPSSSTALNPLLSIFVVMLIPLLYKGQF